MGYEYIVLSRVNGNGDVIFLVKDDVPEIFMSQVKAEEAAQENGAFRVWGYQIVQLEIE